MKFLHLFFPNLLLLFTFFGPKQGKAQEFKIETSETDFNNKLEESAKTAGIDFETVKKYYSSNAQIKNNMMYAIREEKTFEALKKKLKIT